METRHLVASTLRPTSRLAGRARLLEDVTERGDENTWIKPSCGLHPVAPFVLVRDVCRERRPLPLHASISRHHDNES